MRVLGGKKAKPTPASRERYMVDMGTAAWGTETKPSRGIGAQQKTEVNKNRSLKFGNTS